MNLFVVVNFISKVPIACAPERRSELLVGRCSEILLKLSEIAVPPVGSALNHLRTGITLRATKMGEREPIQIQPFGPRVFVVRQTADMSVPEVNGVGLICERAPTNQPIPVAKPHFPSDRCAVQIEAGEIAASDVQIATELSKRHSKARIRMDISNGHIACDAKSLSYETIS